MSNIEEILTRGVVNIIPEEKQLQKILKSKRKLNIYLGIDPTSPHIHIGHALHLRKLQALTELGHNTTLLIGDFTALIGDTSDKDSERPILTRGEINQNLLTYKKQASKILDLTKVKIVRNSKWLSKLKFDDILKLQQKFSVNDFISRELIKNRLNEGRHVRLDETSYPLIQGYDSYYLDTDIQLGGADQTFNMQAGRALQKIIRNKESFILTSDYIQGTDGRKMSKSWGNAIWLDDKPDDMFAKVMAIHDDLIIQYYTLATNTSLSNIHEIHKSLSQGEHPMKVKKKLALQIVTELYDEQKAQKAAKNFEKTVQHHETPKEIDEILIKNQKHLKLDQLIYETELTSSKSEAKRLIEQGGVEIDNEKITDPFKLIEIKNDTIIKIGKHKFIKLKLW